MDKMVEPLKVTVTTKVKANSVKQEFEKQDELKRSAMRALAALMVIPGADKHPQLNEFLNQVLLDNLFNYEVTKGPCPLYFRFGRHPTLPTCSSLFRRTARMATALPATPV